MTYDRNTVQTYIKGQNGQISTISILNVLATDATQCYTAEEIISGANLNTDAKKLHGHIVTVSQLNSLGRDALIEIKTNQNEIDAVIAEIARLKKHKLEFSHIKIPEKIKMYGITGLGEQKLKDAV